MRLKVLLPGLFIALLVPVYADTFVNMTLTGNGPNGSSVFDATNMWGGEPVSPYLAQIGNNNPFLVACLDLSATTNINQSYSYDVTTPAGGDHTLFVDYEAAAILMQQLLGATGDARGELSFAIWHVFNATAVDTSINTQVHNNIGAIDAYAAAALTQAGNNTGIPAFTVYYPASSDPVNSPPGSQRFLSLVPDGGMTLMLLGGALVGIETLRRRFRV